MVSFSSAHKETASQTLSSFVFQSTDTSPTLTSAECPGCEGITDPGQLRKVTRDVGRRSPNHRAVEVIKTSGVASQATYDVADKQTVSPHALNVCEPLGFLTSTRKVPNAERPGRSRRSVMRQRR
jgi:hypothetical protein